MDASAGAIATAQAVAAQTIAAGHRSALAGETARLLSADGLTRAILTGGLSGLGRTGDAGAAGSVRSHLDAARAAAGARADQLAAQYDIASGGRARLEALRAAGADLLGGLGALGLEIAGPLAEQMRVARDQLRVLEQIRDRAANDLGPGVAPLPAAGDLGLWSGIAARLDGFELPSAAGLSWGTNPRRNWAIGDLIDGDLRVAGVGRHGSRALLERYAGVLEDSYAALGSVLGLDLTTLTVPTISYNAHPEAPEGRGWHAAGRRFDSAEQAVDHTVLTALARTELPAAIRPLVEGADSIAGLVDSLRAETDGAGDRAVAAELRALRGEVAALRQEMTRQGLAAEDVAVDAESQRAAMIAVLDRIDAGLERAA